MTIQEQKEMLILAETLQGEINRMCVTHDLSELDTMTLHAKKNIDRLQEMRYKDIKVERKQKIGKWIHKIGMGHAWICSECGAEIISTNMEKPKFIQCPICSINMEE